jgi:hypothetical protein
MVTKYWVYFDQATSKSTPQTDRELLDEGFIEVSLLTWVLLCLLGPRKYNYNNYITHKRNTRNDRSK